MTTFSTIPDAAVSKFVLTITGGPKGTLVITGRHQTVCGKQQITNATLNAQSGNTETLNPTITTPACRAPHKNKAKKRKKVSRTGFDGEWVCRF